MRFTALLVINKFIYIIDMWKLEKILVLAGFIIVHIIYGIIFVAFINFFFIAVVVIIIIFFVIVTDLSFFDYIEVSKCIKFWCVECIEAFLLSFRGNQLSLASISYLSFLEQLSKMPLIKSMR